MSFSRMHRWSRGAFPCWAGRSSFLRKTRQPVLYRRFNDSAIISRHSTSLVPLKCGDKKIMVQEDFENHMIPRCSVLEGITINKNSVEDAIFDMFRNTNDLLPVRKFLTALTSTGLRRRDPRLKEMIAQLNVIYKLNQEMGSSDSIFLDRDTFRSVVKENVNLVSRAMKQQFVIPEFKEFTQQVEKFYWKCKLITGGQVASYIPQLAKYNPDYWGVSLCTVDGQRYSVGDTDIPFTIQSAGKPLNYAVALSNLGTDIVHNYVGQEPSGRMFNELVLDCSRKPHNPMVNAGAIVVCSLLLNLIEGGMKVAEKFDWMCQHYRALAGGEYFGFNNAMCACSATTYMNLASATLLAGLRVDIVSHELLCTSTLLNGISQKQEIFMSEREAADRNYAIGFYMKENKCFPPNGNLREIMDFYFQMCSLEVNCETLSVMASTLANGGICPITGKQVLDSAAVRNVLSLMHSCGMYDYSGQFAFKVGLPAKSGVSGCTMVVVPNVLGLSLWSPPLDVYGNSVRGVKFCEEMVSEFNFHHYDNLRHQTQKKDPRRYKYDVEASKIINLLFGAASGDVTALRRCHLAGVDMELIDWDGRTCLHVASSQGNAECVEFLLKVCKVDPSPTDRWGRTPLDEAKTFVHPKVVNLLSQWMKKSENRDLPRNNEMKLLEPVNHTPLIINCQNNM